LNIRDSTIPGSTVDSTRFFSFTLAMPAEGVAIIFLPDCSLLPVLLQAVDGFPTFTIRKVLGLIAIYLGSGFAMANPMG
jgi:hypothetical protein